MHTFLIGGSDNLNFSYCGFAILFIIIFEPKPNGGGPPHTLFPHPDVFVASVCQFVPVFTSMPPYFLSDIGYIIFTSSLLSVQLVEKTEAKMVE